ncbi:MAG: hypothetical protein R3E01_30885 [Pirellulaceae bacterium]
MAIHLPKVSLVNAPNSTKTESQAKSRMPTTMLSLVKKSGARTAFDYSHLYRIDFDGDVELRLQFSSDIVVIHGEHLIDCYHELANHVVTVICEHDPLHDQESRGFQVRTITIESV